MRENQEGARSGAMRRSSPDSNRDRMTNPEERLGGAMQELTDLEPSAGRPLQPGMELPIPEKSP